MKFIQSACAIDRKKFVVLCLDDEPEDEDPSHDILFVKVPNQPLIVQRKGENIRLSRVSKAADDVAVLSREGAVEVLSFDGASLSREDVTGSISVKAAPKFGFLMSIRLIEDQLYACGMGGQVYARSGPGSWQLISQAICTTDPYERWFSNVDGLRSDYILSDGLSGVLYFFDGSKWQEIKTNTTASIGEMAFVGDDEIYIAGAQSTLLHGSPKRGFETVNITECDLTIYTICRFRDRIFIGTDRGVMELGSSGKLSSTMVDVDSNAFDVVSLQSIDDVLWCFAARRVYRYSGARWDRILTL